MLPAGLGWSCLCCILGCVSGQQLLQALGQRSAKSGGSLVFLTLFLYSWGEKFCVSVNLKGLGCSRVSVLSPPLLRPSDTWSSISEGLDLDTEDCTGAARSFAAQKTGKVQL